jgi:hypothetical protein
MEKYSEIISIKIMKMKKMLNNYLLLIWSLFINCSGENKLSANNQSGDSTKSNTVLVAKDTLTQKQDGFHNFLSLIDIIDLPVSFDSFNGISDIQPMNRIDNKLIEKFAPKNNIFNPYKRFITKDSVVAIIYTIPSSIAIPFIATYKADGEYITGLQLFENGGQDFNFRRDNYVTINKDLTISFTDSTFTWEVDKENKKIEASKKIEVKTKKYFIESSGLIKLSQ